MSVATKKGPWISATQVTRIDCSRCGTVTVSKYPCNERETMDLIRDHAQEHGGIDRGS